MSEVKVTLRVPVSEDETHYIIGHYKVKKCKNCPLTRKELATLIITRVLFGILGKDIKIEDIEFVESGNKD